MKDSQPPSEIVRRSAKYIKANNERFSTDYLEQLYDL